MTRTRSAWSFTTSDLLMACCLQLKEGTLEEASIAYALHEVVGALEYLHGEMRRVCAAPLFCCPKRPADMTLPCTHT